MTLDPTSERRRTFLKQAGLGAAAATLPAALPATRVEADAIGMRQLTEEEKLSRIASSCWPPRFLFKSIGDRTLDEETVAMRKKYGVITMLDFPQWTKDTYPGVYHLDLWSDVFGDPADPAQYKETKLEHDGRTYSLFRWDPAQTASRKWLDKLVAKMEETRTVCQHVSNNAPQNLADPDEEKRREGIRVAKAWMDAAAVLKAKTMRANTGVSGTRIMPEASPNESGYPKNDRIVVYLKKCIESFKELADYGEKVGVKITIENHWGLCANPMNILIVMDEVNHPFCECTPDFGNWEHEYHLFHGIEVLMPYVHTHIHGKYWDRWKTPEKDWNDVGRNVRILNAHRYQGTIAVEYEHGPVDGIEGSKQLMRDILAAL
ncbi:MAG TPA: TIM barrel protein [Vicinamibacteria bacterium]|nr:TIM barrel protein [Vicinamibacteria bacterium]